VAPAAATRVITEITPAAGRVILVHAAAGVGARPVVVRRPPGLAAAPAEDGVVKPVARHGPEQAAEQTGHEASAATPIAAVTAALAAAAHEPPDEAEHEP